MLAGSCRAGSHAVRVVPTEDKDTDTTNAVEHGGHLRENGLGAGQAVAEREQEVELRQIHFAPVWLDCRRRGSRRQGKVRAALGGVRAARTRGVRAGLRWSRRGRGSGCAYPLLAAGDGTPAGARQPGIMVQGKQQRECKRSVVQVAAEGFRESRHGKVRVLAKGNVLRKRKRGKRYILSFAIKKLCNLCDSATSAIISN